MKVICHRLVRMQFALIAFPLVCSLSVLFWLVAADKSVYEYKYPQELPKAGVLGRVPQEQKLVFTAAAAVNASNLGIISEKESFGLPVIIVLSLQIAFRLRHYLYFPSPYLGFRNLYLHQVLPNAP